MWEPHWALVSELESHCRCYCRCCRKKKLGGLIEATPRLEVIEAGAEAPLRVGDCQGFEKQYGTYHPDLDGEIGWQSRRCEEKFV